MRQLKKPKYFWARPVLPEKVVKANGAAPKLKSRAPKKRGRHVPVGTFLIEKGGGGSFREMKSDMPRNSGRCIFSKLKSLYLSVL